MEWIELDCERFKGMTLANFMTVFHTTHLPAHWQDETCIALSHMPQDLKSFWEFQIAVQSTNALFKGTPHHLDDAKLHEHIKAGMNQVLYVQVTNAKDNNVVDFHEWLAMVKRVDDEKCFEHGQATKAFEQSMASTHAASHMNYNPQNSTPGNPLAGPSDSNSLSQGKYVVCLHLQYWHQTHPTFLLVMVILMCR